MENKIDAIPLPVVMPNEVYCPACDIISTTKGMVNEFAAFISCCRCHRLVKVIYANGNVTEVL